VLSPLLVVVEIFRTLIRPFTLCIRVVANLSIGHVVIGLLGASSIKLFFLPYEVFVSIVQGFIFYLLISSYLTE